MNSRLYAVGYADRAVGTMVGLACGDALGAAYEFGGPISTETPIGMVGGGPFNWEPGEWTDDTSMAIPIAQEIANGADLRDEETLGRIVAAWNSWASTAKDVGSQTRAVLSSLKETTEEAARAASEAHHNRSNRSGGNGALMRTAPVGFAYLKNPHAITITARRIAQLTHWEEDAAEACILWSHAISHAIVTNKLNIRIGIQELNDKAKEKWRSRIEEAEQKQPEDFYTTNGWVVSAFQGAWSAIHHGIEAGEGFEGIVERAVRGGGDTDTVAAIAGSLAGAYLGVSRIPAKWRRVIHGWPGLGYRDLLNLTMAGVNQTPVNEITGWPMSKVMEGTSENVWVQHPHDDGVWMASLSALEEMPADIAAVVSMCRVGTDQVPGKEVIEFWLIDESGQNLDAEYVLRDAAQTIADLRAEGKKVVVHCVAAHNRTPAAAVAYSILYKGIDFERAWVQVRGALPSPKQNQEFDDTLSKLRPLS
ncbi:ADP-ribosyl-[dinitrogen reductase] hydrolase [Aurantimicrobium minutum]|uniref:ADP-ribosylglycohydrolase family protein n=1 Tax=Aurantimicrobium minutum TaxID=708131 RepID=UPI0024750661|nr:ADP-ribosylglycohydrolase family protein [Aurantimicrobium minutum]MDH6410402.1 ADP-ribosyl-[dinitrogen reductase] hydrolase [Aurantimicrobium minutum]